MPLSNLEDGLFESIEFCLALLGTIPVPIYVVGKDDSLIMLNSDGEKTYPDYLSTLNVNEKGFKCVDKEDPFIYGIVTECREKKNKISRKGVCRVSVNGETEERVIVIHGTFFETHDDAFILLSIEDVTELEQLKGLLPICMECNKIFEEDKEEWTRIDHYVSNHSSTNFSHGLCPCCAEKLMNTLKK
jgi:hypothetical protein